MDAYDTLPYDRLSVQETHPEQLAALGRLYGVQVPAPATCRVLELGCAAGANIIPMAWYNPACDFVGLDLSESQVRAGQGMTAELGLDNIELRVGDVGQVELGDAGFDYIIAHGLYSWIPAPARDALLHLTRKHLNPGGVAYISFNALPGWRMRGMLREMLLFHTRDHDSPADRVASAREFLTFMETGLAGLDAVTTEYLRHEIRELQQAPDSYLFHEFLTDTNDPLLFADFVADANRAGLRYLCNAELHYQFPAALGEEVEQLMARFSDPLQRQQYLDFLLTRNFHQALLVRDDTAATSEPDFERFAELALCADLSPPRKTDLRRSKPQPFTDNRGHTHPVSHPLTKAALRHLHRVYPVAVSYRELESIAQAQVSGQGDARAALQTDHMFGELFHLFAHRAVLGVVAPGGRPASPISEHPRAGKLARMEAAFGRLVGCRHETLALDALTARLVDALDGGRNLADLLRLLRESGASRSRADPAPLLEVLARLGALED